jgi:hypothetical protein
MTIFRKAFVGSIVGALVACSAQGLSTMPQPANGTNAPASDAASPANAVRNGGFETGRLGPWKPCYSRVAPKISTVHPFAGKYDADIDPRDVRGTIRDSSLCQLITVPANAVLQFYHRDVTDVARRSVSYWTAGLKDQRGHTVFATGNRLSNGGGWMRTQVSLAKFARKEYTLYIRVVGDGRTKHAYDHLYVDNVAVFSLPVPTPTPSPTPIPPLSCVQNGLTALGVPLGSDDTFAVLASATVTNAGPTIVTGNLGVSPGTAVVGFGPGTVIGGSIFAGDPKAAQAQLDLTVAYNAAAAKAKTATLSKADIGGMTITPGVYTPPLSSASLAITGTVTLDGQNNPDSVFIFQIPSTLTTANNSAVTLINHANACNIFWQVGSSATLKKATNFSGVILAMASISLSTGATINGRLLARSGAVTLASDTVTEPGPNPSAAR